MGRPKGSKNGFHNLIKKQCEICSHIFEVEPHRFRARYCSRLCKDAGHAKQLIKPQERQCQNCNKLFISKPSDKKIYCSHFCSSQKHGQKISGRRLLTAMITRNCPICNKQFSARAALEQKFCSRSCANKSYERRIDLTCQICSLKFTVRAKYHDQKYCSRACRTIGIGKTESYLERLFADALISAGITAQKQFSIGTYTVDFVIPKSRIVIECDGDYWHSQPACIIRDQRKDKYLLKHDWRVLRFSEHKINANLNSCIETVKAALNS